MYVCMYVFPHMGSLLSLSPCHFTCLPCPTVAASVRAVRAVRAATLPAGFLAGVAPCCFRPDSVGVGLLRRGPPLRHCWRRLAGWDQRCGALLASRSRGVGSGVGVGGVRVEWIRASAGCSSRRRPPSRALDLLRPFLPLPHEVSRSRSYIYGWMDGWMDGWMCR